MNFRKKFAAEPCAQVRLGKIDPAFKGKHESHVSATREIQKHVERMAKAQYLRERWISRDVLDALTVYVDAPSVAQPFAVLQPSSNAHSVLHSLDRVSIQRRDIPRGEAARHPRR
ncbi:MAG: hypothetical protein WBY93_11945 [Candidatus Binatus sp.]